jgi:FKBP-type peptidyl-prolyl cis-trans isomerase
MKKTTLLLAFLASILLVDAQTKPVAKPAAKVPPKPPVAAAVKPAPVLKNALDSMSYAVGLLDGNFFKSQGIKNVNPAVLAKGFNDALGGAPLMTPEQANQCVRREMQKQAVEKIKPTILEGEKFLLANAKKAGVKTTASGLQYEVLHEGTGAKPKDTNTVKVHYEGFLLNGKKFDSSKDRGQPAEFPLNQVIRGWTEGVQLMSVGSKYKFYIPYQLGYGEMGSGEAILGGSVLIFDVELIEIVR